jgi:hypothetical protein
MPTQIASTPAYETPVARSVTKMTTPAIIEVARLPSM